MADLVAAENAMFSILSADERARLDRVLDKLIANVDQSRRERIG